MKTYYVYGDTSPKRGKKEIVCKFDIGDVVQTTKDYCDDTTYIFSIVLITINNDEGTVEYKGSDGDEYQESDLQLVK